MSIDNMTTQELELTIAEIRARSRQWRHLPQSYTEAGQKVRAAYMRGDHAESLRWSVWAGRALRMEHPSNRAIATRLFNGQEV